MGSSSIRRQVAVVAVSVVAAGWWSSAGPAGATPEEGAPSPAQMLGVTGVCGWFSEEFPDRYESINVCAYDGVGVAGRRPDRVARPVVVVDRSVCMFSGEGGCTGEHHEVVVDRRDFVVDPMLRRARIATTAAGCGVDVEFVATSGPNPHGGVWENHGIAGGPWVAVFGEQTVSRPAQWWGRVCGRFLVAATGGGEMWRTVRAGAAHFPGAGAETA